MRAWRDEWLWRLALRRFKRTDTTVIAVGGGIAKTSTKYAIGAVLSDYFKGEVLVGFGNLNTYLGVPLSILEFKIDFHHQSISWQWPLILLSAWFRSFKPLPKFVVLEYGTDRPGDIKKLTAKLPPQMAVLTTVAPAHVINYGSLEAVADDEGALVEAVPKDGVVFLNKRDPFFAQHKSRIAAQTIIEADLPNEELAVGFARLVGEFFKIPTEKIEASLKQMKLPPQRFSERQIGDWLVLDDSYNANPASMEAALNRLKKMPGRKVAILGTMMELGENEQIFHQKIGQLAHSVADVVIGVGEMTDQYRPVVQFQNSDLAAQGIFSYLKKGDSILVKGSRSVKMEKIIKALENAVL
jgi:UDP-N-acetylmuramoyl-tripeptide--D-alanyl-D-alanine ligase